MSTRMGGVELTLQAAEAALRQLREDLAALLVELDDTLIHFLPAELDASAEVAADSDRLLAALDAQLDRVRALNVEARSEMALSHLFLARR